MSTEPPGPGPRRHRLAERAVDRVTRVSRDEERLDQPLATRRPLLWRPRPDPDTFGRFAEAFARFMGTARFLAYMTAFVAIWILWNVVLPEPLRFDPYAFIFLTLMLSLQASYAAPLILLAQNRQTDRDKVMIEQDRTRDERALADTEFLTREVAALRIALRDAATRDFVRSELRGLLDEMEERGLRVVEAEAEESRERPGPGRGTTPSGDGGRPDGT
ncbi:DUF1003 domain-containing protein [Ornithinicoccus halotolerans]|uniref:DUF1003 domain-containing protein n=1 Tax=Ornithinicoccus halotolerans TaxID=1748220 RepID=UPI001297C71C|nr:DUF1003 domain-containing protein [Ornithinicoccus halotolerans]